MPVASPKILWHLVGPTPSTQGYDIVLHYKNTPAAAEIMNWLRQGKNILISGPLNSAILSVEEQNELLKNIPYARPSTLGEIPKFLTDPFLTEFIKPSKIILGYNMDKDIKETIKAVLDKKAGKPEIAVSHMILDTRGLSEQPYTCTVRKPHVSIS